MDARDVGQSPLHPRSYFDAHGGLGHNANLHQGYMSRDGLQQYGLHHGNNPTFAMMNRRPSYGTAASSPSDVAGTSLPLGHDGGSSGGGLRSPLAPFSPSAMSGNWWPNQHYTATGDFLSMSPMHWTGHEQEQLAGSHDGLGSMYHSGHHCSTPHQNGSYASGGSQQGHYAGNNRASSSHSINTLIHFPQSTCSTSNMKDDSPGWGYGSHHPLSHSPDTDPNGPKGSLKRMKPSTMDPLISSDDLPQMKDKDLLDDVGFFDKNLSPTKSQVQHLPAINHSMLSTSYPSTTHKNSFQQYTKTSPHQLPTMHPSSPLHHPSHKSHSPISANKKTSSRLVDANPSRDIQTMATEAQGKDSYSEQVKRGNVKSSGFSFNVEDFLCVSSSDMDKCGFSPTLSTSTAMQSVNSSRDRLSVIQSPPVAHDSHFKNNLTNFVSCETDFTKSSTQDGNISASDLNMLTDDEFASQPTLSQVNNLANDDVFSPVGKEISATADTSDVYHRGKGQAGLATGYHSLQKHANAHSVKPASGMNSLVSNKTSDTEGSDSDDDSDSCGLTIDQTEDFQGDMDKNSSEDEGEGKGPAEGDEDEDQEWDQSDDNEFGSTSLLNSSSLAGSGNVCSSDGDDSSSHLTFDSTLNESQSQCAESVASSFCDDDDIRPSNPGKRKMDSDRAAAKKRRVASEELVRFPLTIGWKRQIRIRPTPNKDSLRGDVYYFAPCKKKFRTYPELSRYLAKENVDNLTLDHFSFSTRLHVGDFLEAVEGSNFELVPEEEVQRRQNIDKEKQQLKAEKMTKKKERKQITKKAHQARVQQRLERQAVIEATRLSKRRKAEDKLQEKYAKQAATEAAKQAKKERALFLSEQRRMAKERTKQQKQMEKLQRQESIRREKERRLQSIQEARRMKKEATQNAKKEDAMKKAQDRELKRQQAVLMKAQEKEQRKQHLLMIRALESQRKAEERERQREEKRMQKKLIRQRKLEQKKLERQIHREMKKPVEDMALTDAKPLPEYPRVRGLNIPAKAFADLSMVEEFVYCFGHVLDIDPDSDFPSLLELQSACLSESANEDFLFTACHSLLSASLDDPGMPEIEAVTSLGVALRDVDLTEGNISEVLRLFIAERTVHGDQEELFSALLKMPLQSLSPIQKSSCLAFLVNELLCSKTICREIDNSLEHISNLRKDKWTMEGRLRKLRANLKQKRAIAEQADPERPKKAGKTQASASLNTSGPAPDEMSNNSESLPATSSKGGDQDDDDDDEDEDEEEEEESDDDDEDMAEDEDGDDDEGNADSDDDTDDDDDDDSKDDSEAVSAEALERKVSRLEKRHSKYRSKLFVASHTLRGVCMGQDRYKRWYYVLPHAGGVFVESLESGAAQELPMPTVDQHESPHTHTDTPQEPDAMLTKPPTTHDQEGLPHQLNHLHSTPQTQTTTTSAVKKIAWFSVASKASCSNETRTSLQGLEDARLHPNVSTPSIRMLNQDRAFLESLSHQLNCTDSSRLTGKGDLQSIGGVGGQQVTAMRDLLPSYGDAQRHLMQSPTFDFNRLIEQDPQKAAVLLELQSFEPAPIPEDKQVGWWRIVDVNQLQLVNKTLHARGIREKNLHKSLSRHLDYASSSCHKDRPAFSLSTTNDDGTSEPIKDKATLTRIEDRCFPQVAFAIDKGVLSDVEDLEEKVFSASLQSKGWRLPPKVSTTISFVEDSDDGCAAVLEQAKRRLLGLEMAVEKRYLKPPFRTEKSNVPGNVAAGQNSEENDKSSTCQPDVTPGLQMWRDAVSSAQSTSQLVLCVAMLSDCIAWDKSIMKVFCIICRKGDNEQLLLLCDNCDRGCHTYCCTPALQTIPDEDWFCTECILMASGSDQCCVCSGSSSKRIRCGFCPRHYHMDCIEPPLHKTPRSPWACPVCKRAKAKTRIDAVKKKRMRKPANSDRPISTAPVLSTSATSANQQSQSKASNQASSSVAQGDGRHSRKEAFKDFAPCQFMLAELERHADAWPFLVPVNCKQFPEYYQIIKKPMDFHTIKLKLRDFTYKSKSEFVSDARLVFQNCETFNEDDSEVGMAGKSMRKYFDKRWPEVIAAQKSSGRDKSALSRRQASLASKQSRQQKQKTKQQQHQGEEAERVASEETNKLQEVIDRKVAAVKEDIEMEEVSESASSEMSSASEEESSSEEEEEEDEEEEEEDGEMEDETKQPADDSDDSEDDLQVDLQR